MRNYTLPQKLCSLLVFILLSIVAKAQPHADFSSDVIKGCSPLVVQFTDKSSGSPTQWTWDLGNGTKSDKQSPSAVFLNAGSGTATYTIKLIIKNSAGTDSIIKQQYLSVYSNPQVMYTSDVTQGCPALTVHFTDKTKAGSGTVSDWLWDFGEGTISKEKNPVHTYKSPHTYNVSLTVGNSVGCKQAYLWNYYIEVADTVNANFDYNYTNVCQSPAPISFVNRSASATSLSAYQWKFGDGQSSTETSPGHTYNSIGTYNVQLISTNNSGCKDTVVKSLAIGKVGADFTYANACANSAVSFTNTSTTLPASVSWNFGDGGTSDDISPEHVYNSAGKYIVEMTADFGSCSGSTKKEIVVQNRPVTAFDVPKTEVCQLPYKVAFKNNSTGAATYQWQFGDGKTSTDANAANIYTAGGFFNVMLISLSNNGCSDTLIKKNAVRVGPPVIDSLNGSLPVSGCVPQTVSPEAFVTSAEPIVQYKWDFGDGTISSDAKPTHEYNKEGIFTIKVIVFTASGCSDTLTMPKAVVTVKAPMADFLASPLDVCAHSPVAFTDSSKGTITNWMWNFGDGGTSAAQNPLHKYADTGYFTVSLIVMNNGCKDTLIKPKYVFIRPPVALYGFTMDCAAPYTKTFTDQSVGAQTWHWDFGDGTTTNDESPLHNYKITGAYTVQLAVSNGQCVDTATKVVKVVDEKPSFTYILPGEAACRNDGVNFTATNFTAGNISTFGWNFGDNAPPFTSGNATVTHKFTASGSFIPQLITTDILGCNDTIINKTDIKVYGAKAAFTNLPGLCIHSVAAYTNMSVTDGIHAITKWVWSYGESDPVAYTSAPFNHLYNKAGYYDVKLAVYDSYGCKDSVIVPKAIQVTDPAAAFSSAAPFSCTGNKIIFKDSSAGESLMYSWNFGDNSALSADHAPVHTYGAEGIYNVQLIVKDKFSCADTASKTGFITISNPKASFDMNGPTEATCPPLEAKPTNTSVNFTALSWSFGDGAISPITNPTHIYTQGGNFDLQLVAKGFGQCYDTVHQPIKLKGPSGTFSYNPLKGCNPTKVTFNATTKNAVKVIWDYSDGNVNEDMTGSTQHTYKTYGQFIPKLVLTDNGGCQVGIENPDTIFISGIKPAYIFSAQDACDSALAAFVDASVPYWDAVKSYQWKFGDGDISSTKNPTHFYKKSGTYNSMLTVQTNYGCTDSLLQPLDVTVHQSPIVSITAPDSACIASSVQLAATDATKDPTATWQWQLNNITTLSSTQNGNYQFMQPGLSVLTASATTSFGCTDTAAHNIFVVTSPVISAGPDTFVCKGSTTLLTVTGAGNYTWSSKAAMSCSACAATAVSPAELSQYIVSGNNNFGCLASDTVNVDVIKPVTIVTQNDTLCIGENATLQVSGAKIYKWWPTLYLSDATSAAPAFHAAKDTAVTYQITGMDEKKCFSDTKSLTVKVYPIPHIEMMDKEIDLNVGSSVQLMMKSSPDVTQWRWSPASFLSDAKAANPVATPNQSITYTCLASNNGSCFARDQISISVMCNQANMFIPNTFSPNGDGINEHFFPRGKGVFNIKSMRIFNRWGQLVYQKNDFLPNVEADGWDGTFKGQPVSSDVYVYMVDITCNNNTIVPFKGNVTLLR